MTSRERVETSLNHKQPDRIPGDFNTIHNIQAKIPVKNLAAIIDGMRDFNGDK